MEILNELLKEVPSSELDQQIKEVCNIIIEEEKDNLEYECLKGPNIFLSLPCKGTFEKEIGCLCLEREMKGEFVVSLWTKLKTSSGNFKKHKVYNYSKSFNTAEKILKFYAETLKYLKGEI